MNDGCVCSDALRYTRSEAVFVAVAIAVCRFLYFTFLLLVSLHLKYGDDDDESITRFVNERSMKGTTALS